MKLLGTPCILKSWGLPREFSENSRVLGEKIVYFKERECGLWLELVGNKNSDIIYLKERECGPIVKR